MSEIRCVSPATPFFSHVKVMILPLTLFTAVSDALMVVLWRLCVSLYLQVTCFVDIFYPATNVIIYCEMLLSARFCATWKYHRLSAATDHCFRLVRFTSTSRFFRTNHFMAYLSLCLKEQFLFLFIKWER